FAGVRRHSAREKCCVTLARIGLHRRHFAVRRIDDNRTALFSVDRDDLGATGKPEVVIAADDPAAGLLQDFQKRLGRGVLAADRRRRAVAAQWRVVFHLTLLLVLLEGGGL